MRQPTQIPFQTIVIATDLTAGSSAALDYGREFAQAYGARVILTHVIDPMDYAPMKDAPAPMLEEMTAGARAEIERRTAELLAAGIPSHSEVRLGMVTRLLLQVLEQYHADLLVLGTKGGQGAGHCALGSIAEELVRQAPCAVLAVASDAPQARPLTGGHVLAPIQRSTASFPTIAAAQGLAARLQSDLLLLHVRTEEELLRQVDPCAAAGMSFPVTEPRVPVRCLVRDGEVAKVIAETAEKYGATLLALHANRESRRRAFSRHGTAYEVVARARVPVLLYPPEGAANHVADQAAETSTPHQEAPATVC